MGIWLLLDAKIAWRIGEPELFPNSVTCPFRKFVDAVLAVIVAVLVQLVPSTVKAALCVCAEPKSLVTLLKSKNRSVYASSPRNVTAGEGDAARSPEEPSPFNWLVTSSAKASQETMAAPEALIAAPLLDEARIFVRLSVGPLDEYVPRPYSHAAPSSST